MTGVAIGGDGGRSGRGQAIGDGLGPSFEIRTDLMDGFARPHERRSEVLEFFSRNQLGFRLQPLHLLPDLPVSETG